MFTEVIRDYERLHEIMRSYKSLRDYERLREVLGDYEGMLVVLRGYMRLGEVL